MPDYEKSLTEYIKDLKSDDSKIRIKAAIILGEWGNDRAVTPLIAALSHPDENLRRESVHALKEICNRRSIEPLLDLLKTEPTAEVKSEIAYALGFFSKYTVEIDNLIDALSDEHPLVRQNAAFALGKIRRRKSVKKLISLLEKDTSIKVQEMVIWALGEIKDKRAVPVLLKAMKDDQISIRKNAAYALGLFKEKTAINLLKAQLTRPGEAKEAAWALNRILSDKETKSVLRKAFQKMFRDKQGEDCVEICRVLINKDKETTQRYINDMLDDMDFAPFHRDLKYLY
ncbi:MAG: HEAT repeat domain-containing protein [Asgard group archaeon]|nr:HEAT repeat domain-containing protein [Asgard group archaeon]